MAVVFDTNVLVSAALFAASKPSLAVRWAAVAHLLTAARLVEIERQIRACRDQNDDKFLDVAVNGQADLLVTGDADLLILKPFEGIPIVTLAAYLAKIGR